MIILVNVRARSKHPIWMLPREEQKQQIWNEWDTLIYKTLTAPSKQVYQKVTVLQKYTYQKGHNWVKYFMIQSRKEQGQKIVPDTSL